MLSRLQQQIIRVTSSVISSNNCPTNSYNLGGGVLCNTWKYTVNRAAKTYENRGITFQREKGNFVKAHTLNGIPIGVEYCFALWRRKRGNYVPLCGATYEHGNRDLLSPGIIMRSRDTPWLLSSCMVIGRCHVGCRRIYIYLPVCTPTRCLFSIRPSKHGRKGYGTFIQSRCRNWIVPIVANNGALAHGKNVVADVTMSGLYQIQIRRLYNLYRRTHRLKMFECE